MTTARSGTPEMQLRDTSFRENAASCAGSCFVAYLIMNSSAGSPAAQLWMGSLTKLEVDVGEQRLRQQCRGAWD